MAAYVGATRASAASMAAYMASMSRYTASMAAYTRAIERYIHSIGCDSRAMTSRTASMAAYTATMAACSRAIDGSSEFYRRNSRSISNLRQRPHSTTHETPRRSRFWLREPIAPLSKPTSSRLAEFNPEARGLQSSHRVSSYSYSKNPPPRKSIAARRIIRSICSAKFVGPFVARVGRRR